MPTSQPSRSSYVDSLRAIAIIRVYLHHTLWFGWLTMIFPSMWIMFALAGLLTASSLERGGVARTIGSRMRRLLPPLWGLSIVAVPVMLLTGWPDDPVNPLNWSDLLFWVIPLANPTTSSWAGAFAMALWYLRAYLWFVLLSPILLWLFRRWPIAALVTPLAAAIVFHLDLVPLPPGRMGDVVWTTTLYGTAWMLGFARLSGLLERVPLWACTAIAVGVAGAGLGFGWPTADPLSEAMWGTGFVLVLMRLRPRMDWLGARRRLRAVVAALNARAVTIYVWHLPVLLMAGALLALIGLDPFSAAGRVTAVPLGLALLAVIVVAAGWIEDVAAHRRPALVPAVDMPKPRSGQLYRKAATSEGGKSEDPGP